MDDRRAALVLAGLALAGAGVRLALTRPPESAPGDVALVSDTPPSLAHGALRETARVAARLARPLLPRSEEHTSELQSQSNLVCRLLLEKKKNIKITNSKATRVHNNCTNTERWTL